MRLIVGKNPYARSYTSGFMVCSVISMAVNAFCRSYVATYYQSV